MAESQPEGNDPSKKRDDAVRQVLDHVGTTVRSLRRVRGMSQHELAERAGLVQGEISKVESGRAARLATLAKIAWGLDAPLPVLVMSPPLVTPEPSKRTRRGG